MEQEHAETPAAAAAAFGGCQDAVAAADGGDGHCDLEP